VEHRHLDLLPQQWGVAVIESIWERGTEADIRALIGEVKKAPRGAAADAVRRAIPRSRVYGYPALFKLLLETLDG
jgi:hypothetical protein